MNKQIAAFALYLMPVESLMKKHALRARRQGGSIEKECMMTK
jgi:hypothetical protein